MTGVTDEQEVPTVEAAVFRHVVGHLTSGVSVITTKAKGQRAGMTASSVTSLSMDPPMMLVCIHQAAPMASAVSDAGRFAINVLNEAGADLAHQFATPSDDKFRAVTTIPGHDGLPLLEDALAHLQCEVVEEVKGGSHVIFLGRVISATASGSGEPLAYYRGTFGRFQFASNDAAYVTLRSSVVERQYPADSVLDPMKLAEFWGLDHTAVFYALTRLSDDGLVRRDKARGYVVVALDAQLCDETFDARATIQAGALRGALKGASAIAISELRAHVEEMGRYILDDAFTDFEAYLEANYRFHLGIVELAGNSALAAAFTGLGLRGVMARSFGATRRTSSDFLAVQQEILEGIERKDEAAAVAALYRYSAMAKTRLREVLAEHGGML